MFPALLIHVQTFAANQGALLRLFFAGLRMLLIVEQVGVPCFKAIFSSIRYTVSQLWNGRGEMWRSHTMIILLCFGSQPQDSLISVANGVGGWYLETDTRTSGMCITGAWVSFYEFVCASLSCFNTAT